MLTEAPDTTPGMVFVPAQKLSGIDLFQKRLSEKFHASISKGIVGGFEFTVLQRKLIRQLQCLEQYTDHIPHHLSGLTRAYFFKKL